MHESAAQLKGKFKIEGPSWEQNDADLHRTLVKMFAGAAV